MALSKEQIDILSSRYIESLFSGLEQEVINDIARRINKTTRYTETAEIQARNMRELGFSTSKIQAEVMKTLNRDEDYKKEVALNTKQYKTEIKDKINEAIRLAVENGDDMIAQAGDMAWNDDLQMWAAHDIDLKKPSQITQIKKAITKQTENELKNITRTTAFVGTDFGTTGVMNAYQRALDMTALKVGTGTFSYKQAVVDVIKTLSHGLSTIDYASGRKYHIDTAARMAARTACSQLAGRITEANCEATECELVYVDAHPGARPEHAEWQGRVFTYKGKASKKYPDFKDTTGYGSVTGLKGVNCTHNFYPYFDGDPVPEFKEPAPRTVGDKEYTYYEAAQQQRKMEREIRDTQRQLNAMRSLKDPDMAGDIEALEKNLRSQRKKYNDFSRAAGIEPQRDRLKVYDSMAAAKMASTSTTNDWSKTKPQVHTKEELNEITKTAAQKGIKIVNIKEFDGDTELLYSSIDRLAELQKEYPTKRKLALSVKELSDEDFGETRNREITINTKALRDRLITEANIQNGDFSEIYLEDIAAHEYGHFYQKENNVGALALIKNAFYNINNREGTEEELFDFIEKTISAHAIQRGEIISELFGKLRTDITAGKILKGTKL